VWVDVFGVFQSTTDSLRKQVAGYMRVNAADFMPFLTSDSGDGFTQGNIVRQCNLG